MPQPGGIGTAAVSTQALKITKQDAKIPTSVNLTEHSNFNVITDDSIFIIDLTKLLEPLPL